MLGTAFATALSELPQEKVLHCWAPLMEASTNMTELHAKASTQLERLFPNRETHVPDGHEEEPPTVADFDDFDTADGLAAREAEWLVREGGAVAAMAPVRRTTRAAAATSTAAIDAARAAERAPMPEDNA